MALEVHSLGPLSKYTAHDRYVLTFKNNASSVSEEREIVLFRLARQGKDNFYAIESECPHAGGPMKDAELEIGDIEDFGEESVIAVCPWHGYDFDLRTGESSTGMKACTWNVSVAGMDQIVMSGPLDPSVWALISAEPVSEAFAEPAPSIPSSLPTETPTTLTDWACFILNTADPDDKVAYTREALRLLREGSFSYPDGIIGKRKPPPKPPRLPIRDDAKAAKMGKAGSNKSQLVYLHNVTHIEQWAIDLAWDLIARFSRPFSDEEDSEPMPLSFFEDWATIAEEEAKHFSLLRSRLEAKGSFYGAFKTQDGLWDSAHATAHDIKARLSIVCLVHEARGLDVNPAQITKFKAIGDEETAAVMGIVHHDEITHVAAGHRYLAYVCEKQKVDPVKVFRSNVQEHFSGRLKGPFNREDRAKAGLEEEWYAGDWAA
ncbi:DUF455-domain-containing protein [Cystobasidium minutum MCA 4210]|uniref:DUF455-domain-containing protein n=1 Tax=Cystobasidium minutum MCA 4210 TaxID=1397322 RepID=UPI0034CFA158|eukprot:jgi/Rhomi1/44192/CE44191_478